MADNTIGRNGLDIYLSSNSVNLSICCYNTIKII